MQRREHSAQFVDLVAACAQFVTTVGRIVPNLKGEHYDDTERDTIGRGLARVRSAADWIENAVTRDGAGSPRSRPRRSNPCRPAGGPPRRLEHHPADGRH
ncbi:DUF6192 family protein [Streptomyces sp. NPDC058989]|uniref:DUF6192 family protein n=1 Tax=Streptomyces sp. NPDC058989 TaxID=3346686 RepID=UPI0036BA5691